MDNPQAYRAERAWLSDIPWHTLGVTVTHVTDADFGPLWSRFVTFSSGRETEFGFAAPTWAQINPIDAGTFQVIQNGCRLLFDPQHILERLVAAVQYRRRAS